MPDLLAHVLIAYTVCRTMSFHWEWITKQYITIGMMGAFIPDLMKVRLVLPSRIVEQIVGYPFGWGSLHTGGGVILSVLVGVILLSPEERYRSGLLLGVGSGTHLLTDSLLLTPTGHTQQLFWPFLQYRVPSPGLYLSTQVWPVVVTGCVAALVWAIQSTRYKNECN
ncbi:metal-dependent hydrolase [Halorientalis litorea]|uniref:metal-dependent hydrolase n=1 Tax=Halorientalis litorea TaxID=2931977 RepID=UPI0035659758